MKLTLPFPDSRLLPNRKTHWTRKAVATAEMRQVAWAVGLDWRLNHIPESATLKACTAKVTFYPPDKRRRDLDNLLRAIKPYWDGLTDAQLIEDDSLIWKLSVGMGQPDKANPRTEIELDG